MTFPQNGPYESRFGDPSRRPSNRRPMEGFDDYVRAHITNAWTYLDGKAVVAEAESLLAIGGRLRRGDPGE